MKIYILEIPVTVHEQGDLLQKSETAVRLQLEAEDESEALQKLREMLASLLS